ncbi:MAG: DUF1461 domain-containing protein [Coriobacteriia bacterium]|nr:DUF1461 domain-containing protein [Coriobacteriia bacterium]
MSRNNKNASIPERLIGGAVCALTSLCLAWALFGAGLLVCSTEEATKAVGNSFSNWSNSTLPAEDMAAIAEEVRLYSMGQASQDELSSTALEHVAKNYPEVATVIETGNLLTDSARVLEAVNAQTSASMIEEALGTSSSTDSTNESVDADNSSDADAAQEDTGAAQVDADTTQGDADSASASTTNSSSASGPVAQVVEALGLPSSYASEGRISVSQVKTWFSLTDDELSHLSDCIPVFVTAQGSVIFCAIVALAGLIWIGAFRGKRLFGLSLIVGGAVPVALLLCVVVWALANFEGLFAAMHSLFFNAGTWTFDYDSLLIKLFPEAFWAAMAALWAAVSLVLCAASIALGRFIRKH